MRTSETRSLLLALAVMLVISGCSINHQPGSQSSGQVASLPGLTPGVLDTRPVPAGWARVLNGQRFTVDGQARGMATSPADPHTVAGCALPAQQPVAAPPTLVLSNDDGTTWHTYPISGAAATQGCTILADTQQAGTFVVGPAGAGTGIASTVYETTDAGHSWQTLTPPAGYSILLSDMSTTLVSGYLTAYLNPSAGGGIRFAQRSPNGTWDTLTTLNETTPSSFSLDPGNPARIYASVPLGQVGMSLALTNNRGSTWKTVHAWKTAERLQIWTASSGRVFIEAEDAGPGRELWFSPDAGASWREVAAQGTLSEAFVEPDSQVLTLISGNLSQLDLATGKLQPVAAIPPLQGVPFCTASPGALICGDEIGTFRRPLSPSS